MQNADLTEKKQKIIKYKKMGKETSTLILKSKKVNFITIFFWEM